MTKNTCGTCKHKTVADQDEPCVLCVSVDGRGSKWAAREDATSEVSAESETIYGWCSECGPRRAGDLDADGACDDCGEHAIGPGAEQAIKLTHAVETLERVDASRPSDRVWMAGQVASGGTVRVDEDCNDPQRDWVLRVLQLSDALLAELDKKR